MSVFVNVAIDEAIRVHSGKSVLSHLVYVGDRLALALPHDKQKRKETLLWLATQIEQEARKL